MALFGIIADIHGNKEALLAVLEFLGGRGLEKIFCLGDIVGYNADPNECIGIVRKHGLESIAGNHDLISIRNLETDRCSDKAAYALTRTRTELTPTSAKFLAGLPRMKIIENRIVMVHGGVLDVQQYMRTIDHVRDNAEFLKGACPGARMCFFGHTHEQRVFELNPDSIAEVPAQGLVRLNKKSVYFINPGSIDAARKSSPRLSECAVFDSSQETITFHRIRYCHASSEAGASARGYRMHPAVARLYAFRRSFQGLLRRVSAYF